MPEGVCCRGVGSLSQLGCAATPGSNSRRFFVPVSIEIMLIWFSVVCLVIIPIAYTYMSVASRTYFAELLFVFAVVLSPVGVLPLAALLGVVGALGFVSKVPVFGQYLVEVHGMWAQGGFSLLVILWSVLSLVLWWYVLDGLLRYKRTP